MLGSLLPLGLAIGWSVASLSLATLATQASGGAADPVLALLRSSPALAAPIALIAFGAVGSTMIGVILATSQLLGDIFGTRGGNFRAAWRRLALRGAVLALPACFACLGPASYLQLLAFSGAFPTIVLYGLLPPLAALVMRSQHGSQPQSRRVETVRIVPGGKVALVAVALLACTLLVINLRLLF